MIRPTLPVALLAAVAAAAAVPAAAERYRVDLIVFADKSGTGSESPVAAQAPELKGSIEPYESSQLRAAGIEILPDDQFGLMEHWGHLRNSRYHQPLLRLAWYQKDPPADRTVSLHLHHGAPFSELTPSGSSTIYPLNGTVALLVGRYLHLDVDFLWTQANGTDLTSYRLHERRRLKRDELHHLDSPKVGILVRAQRAPEAGTVPPKPEPKKPAKPAPSRKKR
jgi:hypothetical protein